MMNVFVESYNTLLLAMEKKSKSIGKYSDKNRLRTAVNKILVSMTMIDGDGPCCQPHHYIKDLIKDLIDKPEDKSRNDI